MTTDPTTLDVVRARVSAALNPLPDICGCPDRVADVAVDTVIDALTAAGHLPPADADRTVTWAIRRHSHGGITTTDPAEDETEARHWAALWPRHSGGFPAEVLRAETVTRTVAVYASQEVAR